jgi:hypothetical protein
MSTRDRQEEGQEEGRAGPNRPIRQYGRIRPDGQGVHQKNIRLKPEHEQDKSSAPRWGPPSLLLRRLDWDKEPYEDGRPDQTPSRAGRAGPRSSHVEKFHGLPMAKAITWLKDPELGSVS